MAEKFNQDYIIPFYLTDLNKRLKPAAFLNLAEEAANYHAQYLGVGYDRMSETQQAWVMSRMKVEFLRLPNWGEKVNLQSWHKGASGFMFLRDFVMSNSCGEAIVKATTSWVVLDITTRRLARRGAFVEFATDETKAIRENVIAEPAAKVVVPEDATLIYTNYHSASYSDVDMNNHVNNVQYVVWAMDMLPLDVTATAPLRTLEINFNAEVRPNNVVELKLYKIDGGEGGESNGATYFVEGFVEGHNSFTVRLEF